MGVPQRILALVKSLTPTADERIVPGASMNAT